MAQAQPSCGDPLRVDDQTLKGDLEDKAKFLSSLVGDANLKGQIEATRMASSANTQTPVQLILMLTNLTVSKIPRNPVISTGYDELWRARKLCNFNKLDRN
jgi:hypothetical protein